MSDNDSQRLQTMRERLAQLRPAPSEVLQLARALTSTVDSLITHEECQADLPAYIDAETTGRPAARMYPQVKHHLDLCPACESTYIEALQLALSEERGELPLLDQITTADLSFLPTLSLAEYVQQLAEEIIQAIAPELVGELRAIAELFFERVEALGQNFKFGSNTAPALGFGAGELPESLRLLAATYAATQFLMTERSAQELAGESRTGQLTETLQLEAQRACRNLQLNPSQASQFVAKYAELAGRDAQALQQIATRHS
jgi:hypothetical protein